MISHRPLLHLRTPRIPPFAWLVLRVLFLLALVGQGGLLFVYGQPDDDFFFDCEETLVLTSLLNKVALFNLTSRTVYNVTDVTPARDGPRQFAAIDEATRVLYIWEERSPRVFYRRFDATTSTFQDAMPFTLDPDTLNNPLGFDFVNGEMYLIDFSSGTPVVQAQVNLTTNAFGDDATLNITNSSVATLPVGFFQPLAWDSCNRTLYSTNGATGGIAAIDIDTGNVTELGTVTLPDDGGMGFVNFFDITVGPNCELYGIINEFRDGSLNRTLRGSVARIDPVNVNLEATILLAASDDGTGFLRSGVQGIASCSNPAPVTPSPTPAPTTQAPTPAPTTQAPTPAPTTQAPTPAPPTDKCIVHPEYANTKAYDSAESFLAEEVYEVGKICYYPGKDSHQEDSRGNGDHHGRDLSARTIKVCCETTVYPSPDCVPCEDCSINQEVDDACCAWAFWFNDSHDDGDNLRPLDGTYWGGCKTKHGSGHVCCKCAGRYICMQEDSGDCAQACGGSP